MACLSPFVWSHVALHIGVILTWVPVVNKRKEPTLSHRSAEEREDVAGGIGKRGQTVLPMALRTSEAEHSPLVTRDPCRCYSLSPAARARQYISRTVSGSADPPRQGFVPSPGLSS